MGSEFLMKHMRMVSAPEALVNDQELSGADVRIYLRLKQKHPHGEWFEAPFSEIEKSSGVIGSTRTLKKLIKKGYIKVLFPVNKKMCTRYRQSYRIPVGGDDE